MLIISLIFAINLILIECCYLLSPSDSQKCRACAYDEYNNVFSIDAPNQEFPLNECYWQNYRTKILKIYISNNYSKDCSTCTGTLTNPYNNIINAFIKSWANVIPSYIATLTFYLIGQTHFINKNDWGSQETVQIFRRFFGKITIKPLLCSENSIDGCFDFSFMGKPIVFLKTDQFYLFVGSAMNIEDIVFDGSDIQLANYTTNETKYKKICDLNDLNGTTTNLTINDLKYNCSLRNKIVNTSNNSYSLFQMEPYLEYSIFQPILKIKNCEFLYFHSFSSKNDGYKSFISSLACSNKIQLINTTFNYFYLAAGIFNVLSYDVWFSAVFKTESDMMSQIAEKDYYHLINIEITNCSFKNFNYFNIVEKLFEKTMISLFMIKNIPFTINIQSSLFTEINFNDAFTNNAAIFKFINPYIKTYYENNLYFDSNYFNSNGYPHYFYFTSNAENTKKWLFLWFSNNIFLDNIYKFAYFLNADLTFTNDVFLNIQNVLHFLIINSTEIIFQNVSFLNFNCPLENLFLKGRTINENEENIDTFPRFLTYLSSTSKSLEDVFSSYLPSFAYSDRYLKIRSCNFINFNCSLVRPIKQLISFIEITSSNFSEVFLDESLNYRNFMGFYIDDYLDINYCNFKKIYALGVIDLVYGRNIELNYINFTNITSAIFQTTNRVVNPKNYLKFSVNYCNFINISTKFDLLSQDSFDVTSAYVGSFNDLVFNNIRNINNQQSVCSLNFYMEKIDFTNIVFENMDNIRCLCLSTPIQSKAYAKTTFFNLKNSTFNIYDNSFAVLLFLNVLDYSQTFIANSNFSSNMNNNLDSSFVTVSSNLGIIRILNCNFRKLSASTIGSLYLLSDYITNILIANCSFEYNNIELLSDIYLTITKKITNFNTIVQNSLEQNQDYSPKYYYNEYLELSNITYQEYCLLYINKSTICSFNKNNSVNLSFSSFGIIDNVFSTISSITGAIAISSNGQLFMRNNSFYGLTTFKTAGVVFASPQSTVYLLDINITQIYSIEGGCAIFAKQAEIFMELSVVSQTVSEKFGGVFYAALSNLTIFQCYIKETVAKIGGTFYITDVNLYMDFVRINNSKAFIGGHIYSSSKGAVFLSNVALFAGIASFQAASIFLRNIEAFSFENSVISHCFAINKAILYISAGLSNFANNFTRVQFVNNKGFIGIFLKNGNYSINQCLFNNISGNVVIQGESAFNQGFVAFNSCKISNVVAEESVFLFKNYDLRSFFLIIQNLAQSKNYVFSSISSNFTLKYCEFFAIKTVLSEETAKKNTGKIYIQAIKSLVIIENCLFYCENSIKTLESVNSLLHFITFNKFLSCFAENSGASVSLVNSLDVFIENCLFFRNSANYGGSIYAEDTETIAKNSDFIESFAGISGSVMYFQVKAETKLRNLTFSNISLLNNQGVNVFSQKACEITLSFVVFKKNSLINSSISSSFISFSKVRTINLLNIHVSQAFVASALTITNNIDLYTNIKLNSSLLENCYSEGNGAAVFLQGLMNLSVSNTSFLNNTSKSKGGAIFLQCLSGFCSILIKNSTFLNNSAEITGGVLQIVEQISIEIAENNEFSNNSAPSGPLFSALPCYSVLFPSEINETYIKSIENGLNLSELLNKSSAYFNDLASGAFANFSVVIFDFFKNYASLEQDSFIELIPGTSARNVSKQIELFNSRKTLKNGIAVFSDLQLIGQPGSIYFIQLNYQSFSSGEKFSRNIRVGFRFCERGEELLNFQCLYCRKKTYSLHKFAETDENNRFLCESCEKHATCLGYDSLIPEEGYWRFDANSVFISKCNIFAACPLQIQMLSLGDSEVSYKNFEYSYRCASGYWGNLCSQCEKSYGLSSDNECVKCVESAWLFIRFSVICLVVMLFLVVQSISALAFKPIDSKKRSFLKIIVDHFSFVSFISRLNIDWGTVISQYFQISDKFVTTAPEEIFNFNCFLALMFEDSQVIEWINLILISLSPLIFVGLVLFLRYIIEIAIVFYKRNLRRSQEKFPRPNLKKNFIAVFLVVFYNFYPRVILKAFFLFKCISINDSSQKYLEQNPNTICWEYNHMVLLLVIGLPNILIWGFGIPIILSLVAFKFKVLMEITRKYEYWNDILNYLTIDYRDSKYYWETFLFLQKLLVVGLSISSSQLDPVSQGGIMILLFLIFFLIYEGSAPSKYKIVNRYRIFSYMTTISTAAFAILSSNEQNGAGMRVVYLICLMLVNTVFYAGWIFFFLKLQYKFLKRNIGEIKQALTRKRKKTSFIQRINNN